MAIALAWSCVGVLGEFSSVAGAETPQGILHKAVEHDLAQRSADVSVSTSLVVGGKSDPIMRETGTQRFTSPVEGSFTVSLTATSPAAPASVRVLLVYDTFYIQVDGAWYRATASAMESEMGISGSLQGENPTESLGLLYQEGARVTDVGRRRVDGSTMTEYRAVIDFDKRFRPPPGFTMSSRYIAQFKKLTGSSKLPVYVWIDSSGVVRQERYTIALSQAGLKAMGATGAPGGVSITTTVGLSDFGVPVTVKIPATARPLSDLPQFNSSQA